jgi:hypothetical protein
MKGAFSVSKKNDSGIFNFPGNGTFFFYQPVIRFLRVNRIFATSHGDYPLVIDL